MVDNKKVKELVREEENKMVDNKKLKELAKEIEDKKMLLIENVIRWSQGLNPLRDIHIKLKGRYYPLIEKTTGKLYIIDKVQGKKIPFSTLDKNMQFVIVSVLAERKEQIEKEVEEGKKKYLEKKLDEINDLLNKF